MLFNPINTFIYRYGNLVTSVYSTILSHKFSIIFWDIYVLTVIKWLKYMKHYLEPKRNDMSNGRSCWISYSLIVQNIKINNDKK